MTDAVHQAVTDTLPRVHHAVHRTTGEIPSGLTEMTLAGMLPRIVGAISDIVGSVHRPVAHSARYVADALADPSSDIASAVHQAAKVAASGLAHLAHSVHYVARSVDDR